MSAPRSVRLIRAPSLRAANRAAALVGCRADPVNALACVVLVPSGAAADQLQRTFERYGLVDASPPPQDALACLGLGDGPSQRAALPRVATRAEWYALMQAAVGSPRPASTFEREVLLGAAAREAIDAGCVPPFRIGPGLVAQMLDFYDALRRNLKTVDDFERLLTGTLEPSADVDRGAARMLQQTRFLTASFRRFEARCAALDALDEHGLRERVVHGPAPVGIRQIVVTLLDQAGDPEGLWPADFDLMTRLPGLERIDVIATEAQLATGLHERLHDRLPGLVECRVDPGDARPPELLVPSGGEARYFISRDREDELASAIARIASRAATPRPGAAEEQAPIRLDRCALVFQRPLPYLYLARQVLDSAGLAYTAIDSLPLAAEPYVAAFDLVVSFVDSGYTRSAVVALLGTPHLRFEALGIEVTRRHAALLDEQLAAHGYLGDLQHLKELGAMLAGHDCAPAAAAAVSAAEELRPLLGVGRPSFMLSILIDFLDRHDRPARADDALAERQEQARRALHATLSGLRDAEARCGDHPADVSLLRATVRRWIEGRTFAPRAGTGGLTLTDARAAAYGDFDSLQLLGLVEREWPSTPARNIFFPAPLLRELGWTGETDRLKSARAAFADLLRLAGREVSVSSFSLEDDAVVRPAAFVEELEDSGLVTAEMATVPAAPLAGPRITDRAAAWAALRAGQSARDERRYHGFTAARRHDRYRVTAVETYLACPFKYFASRELGLTDETPAGDTLTPLERGRLVHEILEAFFSSWTPRERSAGSLDWLPDARQRLHAVVEERLATLPERERTIERRRFFGTAATLGICDRVLAVEVLLGGQVIERLLEHDLDGEYPVVVNGAATTRVVRGKADRIDLLVGGLLRIIDYKSGKAPRLDRALQLPVYAGCAERQLDGRHGRRWTVAEAAYVPLAGPQSLVSVISGVETRDAAVARAEALLTDAVQSIEEGRFPPRPSDIRLCGTCAFAAICRKDYVDVEFS